MTAMLGRLNVLGMSADVLQGLEDGSRDWRRSGQQGTLGLEAVLIGHILDLDELTLGGVVGVTSIGLVATETGLLGGDAVAGLIVVVVVTIGLDVSTALGDVGTSILVVVGGSIGAGQEGGGDEHLKEKNYIIKWTYVAEHLGLIEDGL
ncbi:hypothetical protein KR038_007190 [Drosophila bunnanda]|nr:hypothetical protein KR038_007190 [Drosophila bunnanda]